MESRKSSASVALASQTASPQPGRPVVTVRVSLVARGGCDRFAYGFDGYAPCLEDSKWMLIVIRRG